MKRLSLVSLVLVFSMMLATLVSAQGLSPGSGSTNFTVMNLDPSTESTVMAAYINENGVVDAEIPKTVQPQSSEGFPISESGLPDGWSGSVILSADTEVVAFAQMSWMSGTYGDGTTAAAYNGFGAGVNKLYFPSLAARDGKQFSRLTIQSAEAQSQVDTINVSITFYDRLGNISLGPINDTILKGTQKTWDLLSDVSLPTTTPPGDGWLGAAVVESTSPIAGVSTMHWKEYSAAYSGLTGGGTFAYLPSATRRLPTGSWLQYTGVIAQNLDISNAADVTVSWYDRAGNELYSFTDSIPANSSHGYNTRHTLASDIPDANVAAFETALGADWNGSVVIESTGGEEIVVIANLQWTSDHPAKASASAYSSEPAGYAELYIPATYRRTDAASWYQFSGLIVQNVGSSACVDFDIEWRDRSGSLLLDFQDSLDPYIAHGYNTKAGTGSDFPVDPSALGDDFLGSVYINAPGCELMGIHNTVWQVKSQASTYNSFGK